MDYLLAEDLLLLTLDDDKGTSTNANADTALAGAVLTDLALAGAVELDEPEGLFRQRRVSVRPGATVSDPILSRALDVTAEKRRTPSELLGRIGKGLRDALVDRLVDRGILERRDRKILGIFPGTALPARDMRREDEVTEHVYEVLVRGRTPDPRTAALIALIHAVDHVGKVIDGPKDRVKAAKKRADRIAKGDWGADAVRDAVAAATAAIVTAAVVPSVVIATTST